MSVKANRINSILIEPIAGTVPAANVDNGIKNRAVKTKISFFEDRKSIIFLFIFIMVDTKNLNINSIY